MSTPSLSRLRELAVLLAFLPAIAGPQPGVLLAPAAAAGVPPLAAPRLAVPRLQVPPESGKAPHPSRLTGTYEPDGLTASPTILSAGQPSTLTVTLNSIPSTNQTVAISTDHPAAFASLPSSVTVPAGQGSATFTAQAGTVTATTTVTVTASLNLGSASASITVLH
jgi:hypothetical protein